MAIEKSKIGINSLTPETDLYNWPEYNDYENGDECNTCVVCGVDFFGFFSRLKCHKCAYAGTVEIEKIETKLEK